MKKAINWLNMVGKLNIIFDTKIWIVNKKKKLFKKIHLFTNSMETDS